MAHREEAEALFKGGFNCAQSVLAAYGVELGIDRDTALKVASAFGAGMARAGGTCGVVTGALMVIGMRFGAANSWDKVRKARVLKKSAQFMEEFRKLHGGMECRELIGVDLGSPDGRREAKERKLFEVKCAKLLRDASKILDEMV